MPDKIDELDAKFDVAVDASPLPQGVKDALKAQEDSLVAKYRAAPLWAHAALMVAVALASFLFSKYVLKSADPQPVLIMEKVATADSGDTEAVKMKHRLFARHWRAEAERQMRYSGFSSIGGPRKLTEEEITTKLAGLSDEKILAAATNFGIDLPKPDAQSVFQFFRDLLEWVKTHPEQVEAFLKILLMLLMLI